MHKDLFRAEAVENQTSRLHGRIVLQSSVSSRLITLAIVVVVTFAMGWIAVARYARTEPAKGIMVPVDGASKIYAMHPGIVSAFMVKEGDMVKAGQKLALITLETPNAAGAYGTMEALDSLRVRTSVFRPESHCFAGLLDDCSASNSNDWCTQSDSNARPSDS